MISSYMALGYQCNHKCIGCPLSSYNRIQAPLTFEQIRQDLERLGESGSDVQITISGGEPTLYPDFTAVVKILVEHRYGVTLLTNATTFADPEKARSFAELLGNCKDRWTVVSAIHSMDPYLHDYMTGTPGSLEETLTGLDHLIDQDIHVSIKHIMSGPTYRDMPLTFEKMDRHFPEYVNFDICAMDYSGRCGKNSERLFVNFRDLQPYLEKTLDLWDSPGKTNRKVSMFETPLCAVDPYYWRFYNRSDLKLDQYYAPGDITQEGIELDSACSVEYEECSGCGVRHLCDGVWRSAYRIGHEKEGFLEPVKLLNGTENQ